MHWCCRTVSITLVMLRRIDFLEVMTCPHQTMVRAPWTISHKYHSIIDFWLKKYLFYTGWHRNAFEMLLKFGLSWVLSGKNTGLTSQCGSWHNTSYGRHLQVRAYYWKKFMQSCHYIHSSGRSLLPGHFLRTTWTLGRLRSCSLAWQQGKLCR